MPQPKINAESRDTWSYYLTLIHIRLKQTDARLESGWTSNEKPYALVRSKQNGDVLFGDIKGCKSFGEAYVNVWNAMNGAK